MDLAQIRYFLSVADHLSFTRAGEELYVSQPTISKQIALLEKELGVKLFNRSNQGVALTVTGKLLYPDFREALALIDTAMQKVAKTTADVRGQISLGIGRMMDINYILPGFFRAFAQVYPGIQLKISSLPFSQLQQKLAGGELDLILTYSLETTLKSDQCRLPVSRSHSYLYYPISLMPQGGEGLSLRSFADKPYLKLHSQTSEAWSSSNSSKTGVRFLHTVEVPDMETMILYLESGLGICIMGRSYRINTSDNIRSIDLTESDQFPPVGTDAIWNKSNRNPSLKLLLDEIRQYTEEKEGLDSSP